jgi:hypothetical protein
MISLFCVSVAIGFSAHAESDKLNSLNLSRCGSYGSKIELRESDDGDLHINLIGNRCNTLRIWDTSNKRDIKAYDVKGSNYTLSNKMLAELGNDCKLGVDLGGDYGDRFEIVNRRCMAAKALRQVLLPQQQVSAYSFQLSRAKNCKLMINGQYSNKLVADSYCQGATSHEDMIRYEVSRNGNCKLMKNGAYANQNVDSRFCTVRGLELSEQKQEEPVDTAELEAVPAA